MIKLTPPLGWNSWNTFGNEINEALIKETADAMVESGLRDAGYEYIVIDDCWQAKQRDVKNHRLVEDKEKFPHGIKHVSDYVHSLGLKFGIYSCVGNMTCTQFPGSYDHEFIDAQTFAEWGVDYLKYDYCFKPYDDKGYLLYRRMGAALANCGRDILFSACSWGADDTKDWIRTTGAHMWRSTVDIGDSWESIKKLVSLQREQHPFNSIGCFNDMDMLVVGMNGKGNVGFQGCSFTQYRTHFSIWALFGSPLMIGCDIRNMDDDTRQILLNKEVIAINQDKGYWQPFYIGGFRNFQPGGDEERFGCAKLLENGDYVIGLFNLSDQDSVMFFSMAEMGLHRICKKKLVMKNLWTGAHVQTVDEFYMDTVRAHDCVLLRARVVDAD